jgi:hypothetical protein
MTGRDLVSASMKIIGALAPGESPAAAEAVDGLASLNRMLDSWSNEKLLVSNETKETFSLTGGTQTYTMGSSGAFNTVAPIQILQANILIGATEYPLRINSDNEWSIIQNKTVSSSIPTDLYPVYSYPLASLSLYPVPVAGSSIIIYSWKQLTRISSLDTVLSMQPGFEEAIIYNLAIRLAPEYGRNLTADIVQIANDSKANVKRANNNPVYLRVDDGLLTAKPWNFYSGDAR